MFWALMLVLTFLMGYIMGVYRESHKRKNAYKIPANGKTFAFAGYDELLTIQRVYFHHGSGKISSVQLMGDDSHQHIDMRVEDYYLMLK